MPLTTNILGVLVFFAIIVADYLGISLGVFNKTIIPLALVGYEIVIANSYPTSLVGYLPSQI